MGLSENRFSMLDISICIITERHILLQLSISRQPLLSNNFLIILDHTIAAMTIFPSCSDLPAPGQTGLPEGECYFLRG